MQSNLPPSVDTLARTIWGEARGCGVAGMGHVANVIVNRADNPRWWGDDVVHVCTAPEQFSCWNAGDPNRAKLLEVTESDPEFMIAITIAIAAMGRRLGDATGGADSYYAKSMVTPPGWAGRGKVTLDDGWHIFLRTELAAPDGGPGTANISVNAATPAPVDEADALDDEYDPAKG